MKLNIMKIERKYRPTQIECRLYDKVYYDRCVEIRRKQKQIFEDRRSSLDDNSVSMMKEVIEMNDFQIEKCEQIFKSSHRTRRPEYTKLRRLRLRKQ